MLQKLVSDDEDPQDTAGLTVEYDEALDTPKALRLLRAIVAQLTRTPFTRPSLVLRWDDLRVTFLNLTDEGKPVARLQKLIRGTEGEMHGLMHQITRRGADAPTPPSKVFLRIAHLTPSHAAPHSNYGFAVLDEKFAILIEGPTKSSCPLFALSESDLVKQLATELKGQAAQLTAEQWTV